VSYHSLRLKPHLLTKPFRTLRLVLRIIVVSSTFLLRTQTRTDLPPRRNRTSGMDDDFHPLSHVGVSNDGIWKTFTGDELGVMFAAWVLRAWKASGKPLGGLLNYDFCRL
jgi:hypothetical protein